MERTRRNRPDGDGLLDDVFADLDGDGLADEVGLDLDDDGEPEARYTDDGSGAWAVGAGGSAVRPPRWFDLDGVEHTGSGADVDGDDGEPDRVLDVDRDGLADRAFLTDGRLMTDMSTPMGTVGGTWRSLTPTETERRTAPVLPDVPSVRSLRLSEWFLAVAAHSATAGALSAPRGAQWRGGSSRRRALSAPRGAQWRGGSSRWRAQRPTPGGPAKACAIDSHRWPPARPLRGRVRRGAVAG